MKIRYSRHGNTDIVYDEAWLLHADASLFEPETWREKGALSGQAAGRGTTWFVKQGDSEWALRHYRRGGLVAKLVTDRYLWTGLARTRAWREWHLTANLHRQGLPVAAPVAARVVRSGLSYTADLITQRIEGVQALSRYLQLNALRGQDWQNLGVMLRRFHDAGLDHADLNAHNILVDSQWAFWLIDFDRGQLRAPGTWQAKNLARLQRSFRKLQGLSSTFHWSDSDWQELRMAYAEGGSTRTGRSRA